MAKQKTTSKSQPAPEPVKPATESTLQLGPEDTPAAIPTEVTDLGNGVYEARPVGTEPEQSGDDERAAEQAFAAELAQQPADEVAPAAPAETSTKDAAAAGAALEAVAGAVPAAEPRALVTIGDVFRELRNVPAADGYVKRSPTPRLSAETAALQARIVVALKNLGVDLGSQDKVYPWLLEQMLEALQPEE